jgi:uncharacterized membrane protein
LILLRGRDDTPRRPRAATAALPIHKKIQMLVRVEMTLMLPAPLFATWMAHGEF